MEPVLEIRLDQAAPTQVIQDKVQQQVLHLEENSSFALQLLNQDQSHTQFMFQDILVVINVETEADAAIEEVDDY